MASKVTKLPTKPVAGTVHWLNECIERGKREVFVERVLLTPGLAAELLRRNPDNRIISDRRVERYVKDIRDGRWALNGETVIIAKTGDLNNGMRNWSRS